MALPRPLEIYTNYYGCWLVSSHKAKTPWGAPKFTRNRKYQLIHRYMYQKHKGEIPKEMLVCHHCDNSGCINPEHLFLGTQKDNMQDALKKERMAIGEKHPIAKLTEKNVKDIRDMDITQVKIARKYNITQANISAIKNRKTWKHIV